MICSKDVTALKLSHRAVCRDTVFPSAAIRAAAQSMRSLWCSLHEQHQSTSVPDPPCDPQFSAQYCSTANSSTLPWISPPCFPIWKFCKKERRAARWDSPGDKRKSLAGQTKCLAKQEFQQSLNRGGSSQTGKSSKK